VPYHILVPDPKSPGNPIFDHYLGSGVTIAYYWESIGEKLGLHIISSLTKRAESEEDQSIASDELKSFREELEKFQEYWTREGESRELPQNFLDGIRDIIAATDSAIRSGFAIVLA
jgi:hypothetical protein